MPFLSAQPLLTVTCTLNLNLETSILNELSCISLYDDKITLHQNQHISILFTKRNTP
jgi:hypothetical protein